jgi:hypothetical protein
MKNFEISYNQTYYANATICFFVLCVFAFVSWEFKNASPHSRVENIEYYAMFFIGSLAYFIHTYLLILVSMYGEKRISLKNGTLSFPKSPISKANIEVKAAKVKSVRLKGIGQLKLIFFINTKRYAITNHDLSEENFSKVCNVLLKYSNRCKACQSKQVTWQGEKGHCHNCETITPKKTDDFDWLQAYQA